MSRSSLYRHSPVCIEFAAEDISPWPPWLVEGFVDEHTICRSGQHETIYEVSEVHVVSAVSGERYPERKILTAHDRRRARELLILAAHESNEEFIQDGAQFDSSHDEERW